MPRNGAGVYSLPQTPFIPNTQISSTAVNSDFSDLANAMTGSLARDGQGGMTAVLPLDAAGLNFLVDPDTGFLRLAANGVSIRCHNIDNIFTEFGYTVPAGGDVQDSHGVPIAYRLGVPFPWIFATAPFGCVFLFGQPCTNALYPVLRAALIADGQLYGNNGTDPLFPDMRGVVAAGKVNMGGVDRGNLGNGGTLGHGSATAYGNQTRAIDQLNLPNVNFVVTGANVSAQTAIPIGAGLGKSIVVDTAGITSSNAAGGARGQFSDPAVVTEVASLQVSTGTVSGQTAASGGDGSVHELQTQQPTIIFNWCMRAY